MYEKSSKDIKRNIENALENYFCKGKIKPRPLMSERKLKIFANLYKKSRKDIKRNIENA